jgi:hypothetical protein
MSGRILARASYPFASPRMCSSASLETYPFRYRERAKTCKTTETPIAAISGHHDVVTTARMPPLSSATECRDQNPRPCNARNRPVGPVTNPRTPTPTKRQAPAIRRLCNGEISRPGPPRSKWLALCAPYLTLFRPVPRLGLPASRPAILRSSSASAQWMPSPSPSSSQSWRASGDADCKRGNHASGTDSRLPSASSTLSSSAVTSTSRASGRTSAAEESMPCLQELPLIISHQPPDLVELTSGEGGGSCKPHGVQPELRELPVPLNMDVRRLPAFVAEEEQSVGPDSQNRGAHEIRLPGTKTCQRALREPLCLPTAIAVLLRGPPLRGAAGPRRSDRLRAGWRR